MAFVVRVIASHRLRIITFAEKVDEAGLIAASNQLIGGDYDPSFDVLADLRATKVFTLESATVMPRLAELYQVAGGDKQRGARIVFLATSDLAFGIARMYGAYRESTRDRLKVTRSLAEAAEWLGVPLEELGE